MKIEFDSVLSVLNVQIADARKRYDLDTMDALVRVKVALADLAILQSNHWLCVGKHGARIENPAPPGRI